MPFWSKDRDKETADPQAFVARREYDKAIKAYRAILGAQPGNYNLNHKVADVLCLAGRQRDSLQDYSIAADGYAREGFLIKSVAILKKMQKIDPGNSTIESRLAGLSKLGSSSPSIAAGAPPGPPAPEPAHAGPEIALDMEEEERPSIPVAPAEPESPTGARMAMTPLFSDFTPEELGGVFAHLKHHAIAAGDILVREGEPGHSLFVLCEGKVKVTTMEPKGKPVLLAEMKEGDFFGEVALLTGKPRTATITSIEDTEVLELTRQDLESLEAKHPRIRQVIKEFYEKRVASTIEAMIQARKGAGPPAKG